MPNFSVFFDEFDTALTINFRCRLPRLLSADSKIGKESSISAPWEYARSFILSDAETLGLFRLWRPS